MVTLATSLVALATTVKLMVTLFPSIVDDRKQVPAAKAFTSLFVTLPTLGIELVQTSDLASLTPYLFRNSVRTGSFSPANNAKRAMLPLGAKFPASSVTITFVVATSENLMSRIASSLVSRPMHPEIIKSSKNSPILIVIVLIHNVGRKGGHGGRLRDN